MLMLAGVIIGWVLIMKKGGGLMLANAKLTSLPYECKECGGRCCRGCLNEVPLVSPDDVKRWLGVDELTFEIIRAALDIGRLPIVFQQIDASEVCIDGLYAWVVRMQLASDGDYVVKTIEDGCRLDSQCVMWDEHMGECKYSWEDRPKGCRLLVRLVYGKRQGLFASEWCPWFDRNYSLQTNAREWMRYWLIFGSNLEMYYRQHKRGESR